MPLPGSPAKAKTLLNKVLKVGKGSRRLSHGSTASASSIDSLANDFDGLSSSPRSAGRRNMTETHITIGPGSQQIHYSDNIVDTLSPRTPTHLLPPGYNSSTGSPRNSGGSDHWGDSAYDGPPISEPYTLPSQERRNSEMEHIAENGLRKRRKSPPSMGVAPGNSQVDSSPKASMSDKRKALREKVAKKIEEKMEGGPPQMISSLKTSLKGGDTQKCQGQYSSITDSVEELNRESTVLYLNFFVVDKTEALSNKLTQKLQDREMENAFVNSLVIGAAQRLITNDVVAMKMAGKLSKKMPATMGEMGITSNVQEVYRSGSFFVMRMEIQAVDVEKLFKGKIAEEHPDKAKKIQKLQALAGAIGARDKLNTHLERKIMKKMEKKLQEVLPEKMTNKMAEKGLICHVDVRASARQAEYFFYTMKSLQLVGGPNVKDPVKVVMQNIQGGAEATKGWCAYFTGGIKRMFGRGGDSLAPEGSADTGSDDDD